MTDDELLALLRLVTDRFYGTVPEEKHLRYAIADWRVELARVAVEKARQQSKEITR